MLESCQNEVDGDHLPVIVMSLVDPERGAALLVSVPHVPDKLEVVPAPHDVVVDRSVLVQVSALAVVGVGGLVREAVATRGSVKSEQGPAIHCPSVRTFEGVVTTPRLICLWDRRGRH